MERIMKGFYNYFSQRAKCEDKYFDIAFFTSLKRYITNRAAKYIVLKK